MKKQSSNARTLRRAERKNGRTKGDLRILVFFVVLVLVMGAIAISYNARLEKQENAHATDQNHR